MFIYGLDMLHLIVYVQADFIGRPLLATRPLALHRIDHHALWLSPVALELTKKSLPTQTWPQDGKIPGGEVVMKNGFPTGLSEHLILLGALILALCRHIRGQGHGLDTHTTPNRSNDRGVRS